MTELSPAVRALLAQASSQHDPSEHDVERTLATLHGGLAFSAPVLGAAIEAASAAGPSAAQAGAPAAIAPVAGAAKVASPLVGSALIGAKGVKLYLAVAAVVGSVGTVAVFKAADEPARPVARSVPATPVVAPVAPAQEEAVAANDASAELALIEAVQRNLQAGDAERALAQLDEHTRRHPRGVLTIEREGLRAIAMCAAGRAREGEAAREAFLKRAGATPIAARVRKVCP